jgi:leader peptidase (prepilin peptidase)/N-methyltransferase
MEVLGWFATSHRRADGRRVGRETLGMGDKYLLAMIGAQVGWRALLGVMLLSSVQGSAVGLVRIWLTGRAGPLKKEEVQPVPEQPPEIDGAPATTAPEKAEDDPLFQPFSPSFLKPGVPWWGRVLLLPQTIFFQDIPDSPPPDATTGEIPDWEPQANSMPFGPWIGLAGIEVMLLGPLIVESLSHSPWRLMAEM